MNGAIRTPGPTGPAEPVRPRRLRRNVLWIAAAAAIVLLFLLLPRGAGRQERSDGLDYWLPIESERVLLRSGTEPEQAVLLEAVEAYARHDTHRVVELLRGREFPSRYDPFKLVLASALVWEGQPVEARRVLDETNVATIPLPYRDRALFVQYVALRRSGDQARAAELAREIASRPGEFQERARGELAPSPSPERP